MVSKKNKKEMSSTQPYTGHSFIVSIKSAVRSFISVTFFKFNLTFNDQVPGCIPLIFRKVTVF